jgi:hypothetical protein
MGRMSFDLFAKEVLKRNLYDYQIEIGNAILDSVFNHRGLTISVLLARQMGKNELSAAIEAYLLTCFKEGNIIKVAPTFKPQVINSRLRLLAMLEHAHLRRRVWRSYGYMIGLAPHAALQAAQVGAKVMFFSAGPEANIVGATASILLEVDEAQDISIDKFNRELRPMASITNSTTVLYGTAWTDSTLLAMVQATNKELEASDGVRRHFHYDWRTLAAINPLYKAFVEQEIARLGEEHITIRTQYRLLTVAGDGYLFNEIQRYMLRGHHDWWDEPEDDEDGYYVAGMDVGGEARVAFDTRIKTTGHDSSVLTVAHVEYNEVDLPALKVVWQGQWTGMSHIEQYGHVRKICQRWSVRRLVIDKTGVGEGLASLLGAQLGSARVLPYHFTRQSKSQLTYHFLNMVSSNRLSLYEHESAPAQISNECWKQIHLARYRIPGENLLNMYVDPAEGHDDYLISLALCCEAVRTSALPVFESAIIPPRAEYERDGRY